MIQFVAQIEASHRADIGGGSPRITDDQLLGGFDELAGKFLDNALLDNQAFGSGADLPGVLITSDHGGFHCLIEVRVVEHDKGVGATQFQYTFLQCGSGLSTDGHTRTHATGEGDGRDAWIGDRPGYTFRGDVDDLENSFREVRLLESVQQQVGAAHDVWRVLEHVGIAGEQGGDRAAQDLPDGEVPRHHGENRAERAIFNACLAAFHQGWFRAKHGGAVFGVPLAELCTFFNFAAGLSNRLAHLQGDHVRHGLGIVAQGLAEVDQQLRALFNRFAAPGTKPGSGPRQRGL
ncbi:hypothetical protein D3C86_1145800 [compost metagenome]